MYEWPCPINGILKICVENVTQSSTLDGFDQGVIDICREVMDNDTGYESIQLLHFLDCHNHTLTRSRGGRRDKVDQANGSSGVVRVERPRGRALEGSKFLLENFFEK